MQVFEGFGQLVDDEADMDILENALGNDVVEVGFHILEQQVDILVIIGPHRLVQLDDVRVLQLLQDLDLAVGPLRVGGVLEGIEYLLEGVDPLDGFLLYFPDVAVGSRAHLLEDGETFKQMAFDVG